MTRRQPLRLLLQNTVSRGALGFSLRPFLIAVGLEASYSASCESVRPLTFLACVQMWLRLVLGLDIDAANAHRNFSESGERRFHHRQINNAAVKKSPARNLEALMRFAPDAAGLGLTLNQYRERFTRLSVLGRVRIYWEFLQRPISRRRLVRRCLRLHRAIGAGRGVLCGAILSPD